LVPAAELFDEFSTIFVDFSTIFVDFSTFFEELSALFGTFSTWLVELSTGLVEFPACLARLSAFREGIGGGLTARHDFAGSGFSTEATEATSDSFSPADDTSSNLLSASSPFFPGTFRLGRFFKISSSDWESIL
jgi:hypothetical protein